MHAGMHAYIPQKNTLYPGARLLEHCRKDYSACVHRLSRGILRYKYAPEALNPEPQALLVKETTPGSLTVKKLYKIPNR